MNKHASTVLALIGALLVPLNPALANGQNAAPGQLLADWNEQLLSVADAEDRFLTLKGLRAAAMTHLAIHDALNAIDARFEPYRYQGRQPNADPFSAAVQAAFEIAASQYPDRRQAFVALRDRWLSRTKQRSGHRRGIALGKAAAKTILGARNNDAWDGEAEYRWHPMGPGVYAEFAEHSGTPQGFVFGAGWAAAQPFMLPRQDHFRSPPPPDLDSPAYAEAFSEVKRVGSLDDAARTPDQTHLALWWKDFVENSHNRLARQLIVIEETDFWQAARLLALLNMSIYDAYISAFENKFFYNHWRPFTAIRWAENDNNPATVADTAWNNTHRHTYAFPSYPSAHGTACAAAMHVLSDIFGNDYAFTMHTPNVSAGGPFSEKIAMQPPQRTFANFATAAQECALSRVYLGIHFRYDSTAGNVLGDQVGSYALEHWLKPL